MNAFRKENRILKIHKSSIKEISGAYLRQTRAGGWMTTLVTAAWGSSAGYFRLGLRNCPGLCKTDY